MVNSSEEGLEYWLGWQVPVCALIIILPTIGAFILISKVKKPYLNATDLWMPCWRSFNPVWLLIYRALVFAFMSWMLYTVTSVEGPFVFYFYTQWTFALVIVYFALGTIISAHGCWQQLKTHSIKNDEPDEFLKRAGFWGYLMQIVYQTCAGAVMLTDIVFWCLLLPFQSGEFSLTLLMGCMHGLNLLFLLLDTALNSLPFPWFRMAYFVFWSCMYIIFQWTLHGCGLTWWPYAFLELSTPWAPMWYFAIALVHIPCYGFYVLVANSKNSIFSKVFPHTYLRSC